MREVGVADRRDLGLRGGRCPRTSTPGRAGTHALGEWRKLGVDAGRAARHIRGRPTRRACSPRRQRRAAFLVLGNFRVIKRYNNADEPMPWRSAILPTGCAVGPFQTAWPEHEAAASLWTSARNCSCLLTARGYYSGDIDGNIGSGSREAIRNYQLAIGARPDGVETRGLLEMLETGR